MLYDNPLSTNAQKVRLVMAEKGIALCIILDSRQAINSTPTLKAKSGRPGASLTRWRQAVTDRL